MDLNEYVRHRAKQMDLDIRSLEELADDLRIKRENGEITDEEWGQCKHDISNEVFAAQLRSRQQFKLIPDPRMDPQPDDYFRIPGKERISGDG
jgi:hypothetical protein